MEPLLRRQQTAEEVLQTEAEGGAARRTRHHSGFQANRTSRQDVFGSQAVGGAPAAVPGVAHVSASRVPDLAHASTRAIDEQTKFDDDRDTMQRRMVGALPGISGLVAQRMIACQAVLRALAADPDNAVCACGSTGGQATAHSKAILVVGLQGCFPIEVPLFTCVAPECGLLCHVLSTSANCLPATPTAWNLGRVRGEGPVYWLDLQLLALCEGLVSSRNSHSIRGVAQALDGVFRTIEGSATLSENVFRKILMDGLQVGQKTPGGWQ